MTQIGMSPTTARVSSAIHLAVPLVSTARPSGIRLASRNTVPQDTDS